MLYFLLGINVGLGIAILLGGAKVTFDFIKQMSK